MTNLKAILVSTAMLLFASSASAGQIVGNDAINRSNADNWSNFVLGMTTDSFLQTGTVTSWNLYANNSGTAGVLLLRPTGGTGYNVIGRDLVNVSAGLNSGAFVPDSGSAVVNAGDILGLFIGTGKIDWGSTGTDSVQWCAANGCITNASTQLAAGSSISLTGGPQNRTYSANVTVVPTPGSLLLLLVGTLGLAATRLRRN